MNENQKYDYYNIERAIWTSTSNQYSLNFITFNNESVCIQIMFFHTVFMMF